MPRLRLACFIASFVTTALFSSMVSAEPAKPLSPKPLQIDWIMRGSDLYGTEPADVRWSMDSRKVYFRWKEPAEPRRERLHWYEFDIAAPKGTRPRRLSEREADSVPPAYEWGDPATRRDSNNPAVVYERDGDIYLRASDREAPRRIVYTPAVRESDPRFVADENVVVFRQDLNLFRVSLSGDGIAQLTDIRVGPPPRDETRKSEGAAKLAESIENELFDSVRARNAEREKDRSDRRGREQQRDRDPFYLSEKEFVRDLIVSEDQRTVLAILETPAPGGPAPAGVVPQYINEDGFVSAPRARPNVGWEKAGTNRAVLLDVGTGKSTAVILPESLKEYKVRFLAGKFSPVSGRLAVSGISEDAHDRWILYVDTSSGMATVADTLHDDAWVNGPGWESFGWTEDGIHLYLVSESGGWAQVMLLGPDGERQALSRDRSEAFGVALRPDGTIAKEDTDSPRGTLYFSSSEGDLGQLHYHRRALGQKASVNLTRSLPGWNEATLSPDGKSLAVVHSFVNRPPELYVMEADPDAEPRQITVSTSPEFRSYPWRSVPVVQIPARDGVPVYARLFTPTKRTRASGAAVVFVHGAGYLQNADKGWTEYPREYMFHHLLAERGYTVLDVDYRGSSGYGRDFRTGIYKHMGGKDLSDVTDSVRWLIRNHKVDPKRVGIYGGSYGGFLTLMALFTEPKTYQAGAALRPVTDWTKYNHGYTSRILGLPQDDAAAYRRSSPIFFAEGLTGSLLLCHGMRDDNVFFQDTVRLTQRLIELGKTEHFETAIYPVESHGFTEPSSWADEYKRIFALFERTIGGAR